jgi:hypothetical protein
MSFKDIAHRCVTHKNLPFGSNKTIHLIIISYFEFNKDIISPKDKLVED